MRPDKLFNGKTLAILSGGGDTPAINSSIECVRNRASMLGFKVYVIDRAEQIEKIIQEIGGDTE